MVVTYEGEDGVDYGGLRQDLLSTLVDIIEESLERFHGLHLFPPENEDGDELLQPQYFKDRLFCYGVFVGQ